MLYPTELRGQMAIFIYFSEYSELFERFLFSALPDSAEFHFRQKVRIFTVSIFRTFSKGDRSNYHLGGLTYPLEGVCNIRFLHKIRIFRDFRVKNKLVSVTFADFTASPERVAPRRVPKMAPFFQNGTKLLLRRRVARVFFCFYDRYIITQKRFSKHPLESEFVFEIVLTIRSTLVIIDNTKISALAVN